MIKKTFNKASIPLKYRYKYKERWIVLWNKKIIEYVEKLLINLKKKIIRNS